MHVLSVVYFGHDQQGIYGDLVISESEKMKICDENFGALV